MSKLTSPFPSALQAVDRSTVPVVSWLHGLAAMGDERWETAIAAFERFLAVTTAPQERLLAYKNLCACYLGLAQYEQAVAILDQAQQESAEDPDLLHSRAIAYACAGQLTEAYNAFDRLSRRYPKFARARKVPQSLHLFRKIQRGKASPAAFLVDYLQEQVSADLDLSEYALVEEKARRMIAADPNRPEGHFALGVALLHQGHYQDALTAYATADRCDPNHAPTLYNIGYTYEKLGDLAQAAHWYERTLQHDAKDIAALHHLGLAYQQMGDRAKAVEQWRKALRLRANYYPARHSLYEADEGPQPPETPLPPNYYERERMTPIVKQRMRQPEVFHNDGLTLTFDPHVGFILEDANNPRNGTIQAGGPFRVGAVTLDEDLLDLMGLVKLLLRMINGENTRDIAILVYYADGESFNYVEQFRAGKQTNVDAHGRFDVTTLPRLFKLRIDSDISTPYGDPMQGLLIYLNQGNAPGVLVNTLGLGVQPPKTK